MLTYAEYIHNYPLPVCNTMIPKPRRKVEVCPKAVHKAIKSICHGGEYTPNAKTIEARQKNEKLFKKLKGRGQLTASEISKLLKISRPCATSGAERMAMTGDIIKTKLGTRFVVFEWRDGATGQRTIEAPAHNTADRYSWMRNHGWLLYSEIAEITGQALTTTREQIKRLVASGHVAKADAGKVNGSMLVRCRWIG